MSERMTASEREAVVARVRYEVEWYAERGSGDIEPYKVEVVRDDLRALCAEVERLTREREEWQMHHALECEKRNEVEREVERLREDAARLDWLERYAVRYPWVRVSMDRPGAWCLDNGNNAVAFDAAHVRAAIDAARTTGGRDA